MNDYNDGKWHGWNGGECPVHLKSKVEVAVRDPDELIRSNAGIAGSFQWDYLEGDSNIIAFRVVKEHREPREWWLCGSYICETREEVIKKSSSGYAYMCPVIHVREVLE